MDPRFEEHFKAPRNVGDLPDATARAVVENPVCGDRLTLALRVEAGRIAAVAWRCLGCSGSIAAASALSEAIRGLDLGAARRVDRDAVDAALGGLPALKRHGADLAADALAAALAAQAGTGRAT